MAREAGQLDLLVNNAGFSQVGAVVANVGSIVGLFTTPFAGAYCSSKAALLRNPPPRVIRGGTNCVRLPLMKRLLPAACFDAKLMKVFGLDALR